MGLEIKINQLNVSNYVFHFSQRLTGKGPDSLEELREIALDAEDEEEEHKEEDEDQQEDGRKAWWEPGRCWIRHGTVTWP